MAGPIIHAFDADGTPSEGALIALEKWCRECVAERVQDIINESHLVQWYGNEPPQDGTFLRYNAAENMWDSVSLEDLGLIAAGTPSGTSDSGTTTTTTTRLIPVGDLIVGSPDSFGNSVVSGTAPTGPDSFGNYAISSTGVTGPDAFGNYTLASN